jgi:hypothetical protein
MSNDVLVIEGRIQEVALQPPETPSAGPELALGLDISVVWRTHPPEPLGEAWRALLGADSAGAVCFRGGAHFVAPGLRVGQRVVVLVRRQPGEEWRLDAIEVEPYREPKVPLPKRIAFPLRPRVGVIRRHDTLT